MMKKSQLIIIGLAVILIMFSACTNNEDAEEEIKQISKDIILINDDNQLEYEKIAAQFIAGEVSDNEYEQFLEEKFIPRSEEVKEYLANYKEPSTELAKRYYDVAHTYITVSTNILLTLGEKQLIGVKGELTHELAQEYDDELQRMVKEYDELREELTNLEETFAKEHDIRFEIIN